LTLLVAFDDCVRNVGLGGSTGMPGGRDSRDMTY